MPDNPTNPYDEIVAAAVRPTGAHVGPRRPHSASANYDEIINRHATANNMDGNLVRAVMGQESGGDRAVTSPKGARGLMQLMPATAKRFGVTDITDPEQNIAGGTRYLKYLSDRYNGDTDKILAGYNAGEGAVDKFGGVPPYRETQAYIPAVKARYQSLSGQKPKSTSKPTPNPYDSIVDAAAPTPFTDTQAAERDVQTAAAKMGNAAAAEQSGRTTKAYDDIVSAVTPAPQTTGRGAAMARVSAAPPSRSLRGSTVRAMTTKGWGTGTVGQGVVAPRRGLLGPQPSSGVGGLRQLDDPETSRIIRAQQSVTAEQTPAERQMQRAPGTAEARLLDPKLTENEEVLRRVGEQRDQEAQVAKQTAWEQANAAEIAKQTEMYRNDIRSNGMTKWLTELQGKGAAQLAEFGAGVANTAGAAQTANTLRIRAVAAAQAAQEESADRSQASKLAQDILGGFAGSAPELLLMQAGLPPIATFALGGGVRAKGMGRPVAPAVTQGALQGAAFEIPTGGPGVRGALSKAGKIGLATTGVDLATGAPVGQALRSGATNALMAGGPEVLRAATEARVPPKGETRTVVPDINAQLAAREAAVRPTTDAQGNVLLNADELAANPNAKLKVRMANEQRANGTIVSPDASGDVPRGAAPGLPEVGTTSPRHVDVQTRRVRNTETGNRGQFKAETTAQAKARRTQVEQASQPVPPFTSELDAHQYLQTIPDAEFSRYAKAINAAPKSEQSGAAWLNFVNRHFATSVSPEWAAQVASPLVSEGVKSGELIKAPLEGEVYPPRPKGPFNNRTAREENDQISQVKYGKSFDELSQSERADAVRTKMRMSMAEQSGMTEDEKNARAGVPLSPPQVEAKVGTRPQSANESDQLANSATSAALPEAAARPAASQPTKPVTRNFRAGPNEASLTFDSETQRDLYDAGARLRSSMRDTGRRGAGFSPTKDAAIIDLATRLGISEQEATNRALDTHKDVREQMKGVKDGESRTVKDNVSPQPVDSASKSDPLANPATSTASPEAVKAASPPVAGERSFPKTLARTGREGGNDRTYDVFTDKDSRERADARIAKDPTTAAAYVLQGDSAPETSAGKERIATGLKLADQLALEAEQSTDPVAAAAKHAQALDLYTKLSTDLTTAGQTVQAASQAVKYSITGAPLEVVRIAKRNGVTPKASDIAEVREMAKRQDDLETRLADMQATIKEMQTAAKTTPKQSKPSVSKPTTAKPHVETLADRLTRMETEARASLADRAAKAKLEVTNNPKGQRGSGLNPVAAALDIADWTKIGAAKIARGGMNFASWSKEMVGEFGEAIKPHLNKIFMAARNLRDEHATALKDEATQRSATKAGMTLGDFKQQRYELQTQKRQARLDMDRKFKELEKREQRGPIKKTGDAVAGLLTNSLLSYHGLLNILSTMTAKQAIDTSLRIPESVLDATYRGIKRASGSPVPRASSGLSFSQVGHGVKSLVTEAPSNVARAFMGKPSEVMPGVHQGVFDNPAANLALDFMSRHYASKEALLRTPAYNTERNNQASIMAHNDITDGVIKRGELKGRVDDYLNGRASVEGPLNRKYVASLADQAAEYEIKSGSPTESGKITPSAKAARVKTMTDNPTQLVDSLALQYADKQLYAEPLGPRMQKISDALNAGGPIPRALIQPFFKRPSNALKDLFYTYSGARAVKEGGSAVIGAIKGDEWTPAERQSFNQAAARGGTVYSLFALGAALAGRGLMTSQNDKAHPASLKVGNSYYAIGNKPVIGWAVAAGATAKLDGAKSVPGAIARMIEDHPLLRGIKNTADAIEEGAQAAQGKTGKAKVAASSFVAKTIGRTIPTPIAATAETMDTQNRNPKGLLGPLKSRIPGLRSSLPATGPKERGSAFDPFLSLPLKPRATKGAPLRF